MVRKKFIVLALVAVAFLVQAPPVMAGDGEKSFLWRVEGDEATVYLLGSIHALKEDSYPLAPAIEDAFSDVRKLVFEVDLDELNSAAFQMLAAGSLDGGKTLESVIGPEVWADFSARTRAAGWDPAMCRTMKPWMAAVTLTSFEMMSAGYLSTEGVDSYFTARAKEAGKERKALETVDFQVSLFADLTPEQSLTFLQYTLVDLETIVPQLDELTALWKAGEVEPVEELLVEGFEEFPDLYQKIVTDRNRNWMPEMERLLAGYQNTMVVVGSLHLVGEEGLVELLRKKGYTVEQL